MNFTGKIVSLGMLDCIGRMTITPPTFALFAKKKFAHNRGMKNLEV